MGFCSGPGLAVDNPRILKMGPHSSLPGQVWEGETQISVLGVLTFTSHCDSPRHRAGCAKPCLEGSVEKPLHLFPESSSQLVNVVVIIIIIIISKRGVGGDLYRTDFFKD